MIITVRSEWWADAERAAALPWYKGARDTKRLTLGLVAERAVIAQLMTLSDDAVTWLSAQPAAPNYNVPWDRRQHMADLRWRDRALDVKLMSVRSETLLIKAGAQHLDHVFTAWHRFPKHLAVLGVLTRHQPETFNPAVPLVNPHTGAVMHHLRDAMRAVRGWAIPRARLQPITALLEDT